jgi:TQXA domain-containing protein/LPXTG-motif cell wall-anchored protein
VVLGGLMSFAAAGVAAAADATTTPVKGTVGVKTNSQGGEIGYPLFDGQGAEQPAVQITLTIGGEVIDAYCIDLHHELKKDVYQETAWKASTVANLEKVQWILVNSVPNLSAEKVLEAANVKPEGVNPNDLPLLVYAATQGSIWHFSDGFELGTHPGAKYDVVKGVYKYLVDHAVEVKEPAPTLGITPANATGEIGTKLGPYTVNSPSEPAALKATGGKIVDANGTEVTSPVKDGGKFWLTSDQTGKVTVDATAAGAVPTGRVFTFPAEPDKHQKIILAGKTTTKLIAHATGTFTPKAAPTLPVTGASAVGAAVGGVALLGGGGLLVAMLRRRRIKFTA